ncbi:MAG: HDIG domain-containing protein [Candidatus Margulisbacteria bacterium]|jgi:putative nucleotidyltransferase with HDIG domain|nr:HDIG domain-containing protein [Candidatus Margulisiibacteriota bacterium]
MTVKKLKHWLELLQQAGIIELSTCLAWFALSSAIIAWPWPGAVNWTRALSVTALNGIFLTLLFCHLLQNKDKLLTKRILLLLAIIFCLVLLIASYLIRLHLNPLFTPVTSAALIFSLVYGNKASAFYLSIYLSFLLAINLPNSFFYFTVFSANALFTICFANRLVERNSLASSSLRSALGSIAAAALLYLLAGQFDLFDFYRNALAILAASLGSVVIILGLLPYIEDIFYVVTPTKLLELASPNNTLLKRLSMEAPGTYHHSLIVANLAENATEALNGNALLARVGAYYHDIGKIKRPLFFVENQSSFDNPHDQINPRMSSIIITSHTKEGVELGKTYKLPRIILNIIEQHHGNSVMTYFFRNFQELNAKASDSEKSVVSEDDFRYSGPKPQTREAAVIMLADSCEAAVRSLEKPTPSRISNMLGKIIKEKMDTGQLEDSQLTFQDITVIRGSFQHTIGNMFHNRIKYNDKSAD